MAADFVRAPGRGGLVFGLLDGVSRGSGALAESRERANRSVRDGFRPRAGGDLRIQYFDLLGAGEFGACAELLSQVPGADAAGGGAGETADGSAAAGVANAAQSAFSVQHPARDLGVDAPERGSGGPDVDAAQRFTEVCFGKHGLAGSAPAPGTGFF